MDKPSGIMEKPLIDPLSWLSPSPKPQAYYEAIKKQVRRGAESPAELPTGRDGAVYLGPDRRAGALRGGPLRRRAHPRVSPSTIGWNACSSAAAFPPC